jgi:hypothetical protein
MASFVYAPLASGSSEIRFITLEAGHWDDDIICDLYHDNLDNNPVYEALSYTWGDKNDTTSITMSGKTFTVRSNLKYALRHLRLVKMPRVLWIDALCIDQKNLLERSNQVGRMREIYACAEKVIAWTGEAYENSDRALNLIKETSKLAVENFNTTLEDRIEARDITLELLREIGFDLSADSWLALVNFWKRPYWRRIWVVQELGSSGDPFDEMHNRCVILCGHNQISLYEFTAVCTFVYMIQQSYNFISNARIEEPLRTLFYCGDAAALEMHNTLIACNVAVALDLSVIHIMSRTKDFGATDIRDKLYALLGLAREKDRAIIPDYSLPRTQIYTDLIRFLLEQDLDLSCLGGNRLKRNNFGPSWLPELYFSLPLGLAWSNVGKMYEASAHTVPNVSFNSTKTTLQAAGIFVGTINRVIGPFAQHSTEAIEGHDSDIFEFVKATGASEKYDEMFEFTDTLEESQHELYWRSQIMDADFRDPENAASPAPADLGISWRSIADHSVIPVDFEPLVEERERCVHFSMPYFVNVEASLLNRCTVTTECGRMGIGPYNSKVGDVVAILLGGDFCFVLRPNNDQYELVGDAYIHGVMKGELFGGLGVTEMPETQTFTLC